MLGRSTLFANGVSSLLSDLSFRGAVNFFSFLSLFGFPLLDRFFLVVRLSNVHRELPLLVETLAAYGAIMLLLFVFPFRVMRKRFGGIELCTTFPAVINAGVFPKEFVHVHRAVASVAMTTQLGMG